MDETYFEVGNPGSFGGVEKLRRVTKEPRRNVIKFLEATDTYNQFKPIRHRFIRRKTLAYHKNELFAADLADFQKLSRYNSGYRFVLVCIDVLSKFVFYIPVKNKKSKEMKRGFGEIFKVAKPKLLFTDRGQEFVSRDMKKFFAEQGVHLYHTFTESKATVAERQVRTLKEALTRIFHHTGSYRYVDKLKQLADSYNNTPHSRTLVAPAKVNRSNEQLIFKRLFGGPRRTSAIPKYKINDQVRVALTKGIFVKGYERRWSEEIFTIKRIKLTSDPIMYYIQDENQQEILGGFYEYELNRVVKQASDLWDIEKIIRKRRGKNGKTEYLVKWRGYGNEFNSWVSNIHKK